MRVLLAVSLVGLATLLAGCATNPSPVGDAEAAHAGVSCPDGTFVAGFNAAGSPQCASTAIAGFACPKGEVLVGFDAAGAPACAGIMTVAEEAMRDQMGEHAPPPPARSLALTSQGAIKDGVKTYTVASASPDMRWGDLTVTIDGREWRMDGEGACEGETPAEGAFLACGGPVREGSQDTVDAGDTLTVSGISSGVTMRLIDASANSVIMTLTVG